jgi:hypothetical protein
MYRTVCFIHSILTLRFGVPGPSDLWLWRLKIDEENIENCKGKIQNFVLFLQIFSLGPSLLKLVNLSGRYFGFGSTCLIDCESMGFVFK